MSNDPINHESITPIAPAQSKDTGGVVSIRHRKSSVVAAVPDLEKVQADVDFKKRQEFRGWSLVWLAWQATGTAYTLVWHVAC